MEVTLERLGPCQAKVHFTVPSSEFQATYRRGLQNMGTQVNMKGFRPGKVPPQILEKQLGPRVRGEAIEHFVRQAFDKAVAEHQLKIVGFQRVNMDEVKILDGVDWTCAFEVSLRPDIELGNYKGIAVESELEGVVDVEITNAIENLKGQQSRPEAAGDAGLPDNGMAVAKIEWLDGERVVLERDNMRLGPTAPTPGVDPDAFKTALVGSKDGDTRDIPMTFPADFPEENLRGKPGVTRIKIAQAYTMIPPTDAEIRTMLGVADDAAMKVFVREKIGEAKQQQEDQRVEGVILEKLLAAHTIELPKMMVDEQTRARLEQTRAQLKEQGAPEDKIAEQVEANRAAAHEASEKGLRALFLVQTIGDKEKLLVSRDDMDAELRQIAARNKAEVEEVRKYYTENKLFDQMAVEILERKVRKFLRENAKITVPS